MAVVVHGLQLLDSYIFNVDILDTLVLRQTYSLSTHFTAIGACFDFACLMESWSPHIVVAAVVD
jgi:hypothetical protein